MIGGWGPADRDGISELAGGGAASPSGFTAAGVTAGVKPSGRPDLALLVSEAPGTTAAAVTTQNLVKAPSCRLTERHVADGAARAVVVSSGNANVCAPDSEAHAARLAASAASATGLAPEQVLVCSTGVIGVPLPIERVEAAMPAAAAALSVDGGAAAAEAMTTTDGHPKQLAVEVADEQGSCVVGGMAKGVGMIEPSMATLLVVLTTDAPVPAPMARQLLRRAVGATFNRISIDGDGSTSDTAALLASGQASRPPGPEALARGLHEVCARLAHQVVADGEGASRVAAITVSGAATEDEAERLARSVATSLLVRAAIHGADPNWGRILMALGNAGVDFDPARVQVRCGGITVCRFGVAASFDRGQAAAAMDRDEVEIEIEIGSGRADATMLTCDLTCDYVRFNSEYTT